MNSAAILSGKRLAIPPDFHPADKFYDYTSYLYKKIKIS